MNKCLVAITLCLVLSSAWANTNKEGRTKFKQVHEKCQSDPATAIPHVEGHGYDESVENMGPHAFCMTKIFGWQDANGKILKDTIKTKLATYEELGGNLDEIFTECVVDKEDKYETAKHLVKCFYKHVKAE